MSSIEEIRARWESATVGPFGAGGKPNFSTPEDHNPWWSVGIDHPDARFIGASWGDVRDLLGEVEARDAEIARLRAALSGLLGGMNGEPETRRGTSYRGGFHTEAIYQEAVAALIGEERYRALTGDALADEAVES